MQQEPTAETAILKNEDYDQNTRNQHRQSGRYPSVENTWRYIVMEVGDEQ
jgi:hypothetical protein